jgi:hypothetical protein
MVPVTRFGPLAGLDREREVGRWPPFTVSADTVAAAFAGSVSVMEPFTV